MRKLVALLMCFAVPAAGLGVIHHETTEVHAFCVEHGHAVHEDAAETAGWNASADHHEGCALEEIAPVSAREDAPPVVLAAPVTMALALAPSAYASRASTRAVLGFAPKTSPPLV